MNTPRPRNYALIAVAIVVAAVIIAASLFITSGGSTTITKTVSEGAITTETTKTNNSTTTCTIAAEGFLLMKVLNSSSGKPVSSLPVQVEAIYPACLSNPPYKQDLGTINTNASGVISLSGPYNWYYFSIKYGPRSYAVNATINAGIVTCVTFTIPAGDLNITQSCNLATSSA